MFRRISRQERERRAARAELETTLQALRSNERAFTEAQDPFYIDQLTYQHAALMCRWRAAQRSTAMAHTAASRQGQYSVMAPPLPPAVCEAAPGSGTECAVCWQGPSAVWARWPCWACWSR